ncbi:MAG: YihY/virulence factor BrkB family protein [Candidatus Delongbacteria bacterium]|nr:YihY/virulence factor BrkB family protein [Candidatus Delongbacteria bacterium]MBN2833732.1 YihY/virulence factor BrkB family protein [Candidatus Delongbacteria bacterium]
MKNYINNFIEGFLAKSSEDRSYKRELGIWVVFIRSFNDSKLLSKAASLAFSALLSLIPFLAVLFMIFKFIGGKEIIENRVKPFLYEFLTPVNGDKLATYLDSFIESAKVETIGSIGIIFLFITVYSIFNSIEDNFNQIWKVKNSRKIMERVKSFLLLLILSPILFTISFTLSGYFQKILEYGDSIWGGFSGFSLGYILPFLLVMIFFFLLIIFIPNTNVKPHHALVGSFYGAIGYHLSKSLFVSYTTTAVSTNIIYGSLAVLPFFMLWLYVFWIIVLSSVKIAFIRQNYSGLAFKYSANGYGRGDYIKITIDLLFYLYKSYEIGENKYNLKKLSKSLEKPPYLVDKIVTKLRNANLILAINEPKDVLIPSMPSSKLKMAFVLDALDNQKPSHIKSQNEKIAKFFSDTGNISNPIRDLYFDELFKD